MEMAAVVADAEAGWPAGAATVEAATVVVAAAPAAVVAEVGWMAQPRSQRSTPTRWGSRRRRCCTSPHPET